MAEYREFQDGELIPGTRYRVVQLIGVGGMGSVYEVEHVELGKRFVLKALLRELARREDLVIRLRNEWRALGRLEHPSIVTVTDAGASTSGVPFYVMERLEGETLAQRMRRVRRFAVRDAMLLAAGVLEGLAAAHEIGVVHRDVKPPNIFILPDGRPKVLDFGVAKILDDPGVVTARGVAVGTPRYMSPEQARGESVDGRSDIYSVGLILFEVIAGVSPFDDARDANELILAHLARQAPPLSSLAMDVPAELDALVLRMLAKPRGARPESANGAARALRDIADNFAQVSAPRAIGFDPLAVQERTWVPKPDAPDTTRPDGIATKESNTEAGSAAAEPSRFERTTLIQPSVPFEASASSLRAVVTNIGDTVISGPPSLSASEAPTPNSRGSERTEILTQSELEVAPTRTSFPSPSRPPEPPASAPEPSPSLVVRPSFGVPRWAVFGASALLFVSVLAAAFWPRSSDVSAPSSIAINPARGVSAQEEQLEASEKSRTPTEEGSETRRTRLPAEEAKGTEKTQGGLHAPAAQSTAAAAQAVQSPKSSALEPPASIRAAFASQGESVARPRRRPVSAPNAVTSKKRVLEAAEAPSAAPSSAPAVAKKPPPPGALPGSGL